MATNSKKLHRADRVSGFLYTSPFFLIFAVFGMFPIVYTFWVAFHKWDPFSEPKWIGLDNFTNLMADDRLWLAVKNTFSIWLLSSVPQIIFALFLAWVLNHSRIRGNTFWRSVVLIPNITSVVAVAVVFGQLFGREYGMVNWLLTVLGFSPIDWVNGSFASHVLISIMVIWRWTGYNALIYLAAMQAVPEELYEAAEIDGASKFRQFISVTIPQIRPTLIFTIIVSTIGGLQIFAEPLILDGQGYGGGVSRQFSTVTLFMFEQGFSRFEYGYASAIAIVLTVIIISISLVNFLIVRKIQKA
ncbi:MAG: sugar ABC transporter permease [Aquiluna sp.]|nr:sugar ABC transporter permease [Aquiluna sp.]MCF8545939.1 sugar ABC transporter permease [Aquiluna sp.]